MNRGSLGDARLDPSLRRAFGTEHGRDGIAIALADDDDDFALAVLVLGKPTIHAVLGEIGGA